MQEQINTFQVKAVDQKELASSSENKMPPTGAPKAAATPDAAPPLTKFRLFIVIAEYLQLRHLQKSCEFRHMTINISENTPV